MEFIKEGLGVIVSSEGKALGMVRRDPSTGQQIFFKCTEMGLDEIEDLFNLIKLQAVSSKEI